MPMHTPIKLIATSNFLLYMFKNVIDKIIHRESNPDKNSNLFLSQSLNTLPQQII